MLTQGSLIRASCVSFLVGIAASIVVPGYEWFIVALFAISAAFVFGYRSKATLLVVCALIIGCFWVRGFVSFPHDVAFPESGAYSGTVVYADFFRANQRLTIRLEEPAPYHSMNVYVNVPRQSDFPVDSQIRFSCRIKLVQEAVDPSREQYYLMKGISGFCGMPHGIEFSEQRSLRSWIFSLRTFLAETYQRLPEPESSLIAAMVINRTGEIPEWIWHAFQVSGMIHIISISGLHMGVLIIIFETVLGALGISRSTRMALIVLFSGVYLLMIGFPSPAVRSVVMALLVLGARLTGRPVKGLHVLLVSGTAMVALSPLSLIYDVSFQLSFLALAGIMLATERLEPFLWFVPESLGMRSVVATTLGAQILTWPVTAYYFGSISLVAVLTNIFVIALLAPILIIAIVYPFVVSIPILNAIFGWSLFFSVKFLIVVAELGSRVPFSSIRIGSFTPMHLAVSFALMLLCWFGSIAYQRSRSVSKQP